MLYIKNNEILEESAPGSDLLVILDVKTRRKNRVIAYNANTKESYVLDRMLRTFLGDKIIKDNISLHRKIELDAESIKTFDASVDLLLSGECDARKKHRIEISPSA